MTPTTPGWEKDLKRMYPLEYAMDGMMQSGIDPNDAKIMAEVHRNEIILFLRQAIQTEVERERIRTGRTKKRQYENGYRKGIKESEGIINRLDMAVKYDFPRGKRLWCIECAKRIKKYIETLKG